MQSSFHQNLTVFALFVLFASVLMKMEPKLFCHLFFFVQFLVLNVNRLVLRKRDTFDEGFVAAFITEAINIKLLIKYLLHVFVLYVNKSVFLTILCG